MSSNDGYDKRELYDNLLFASEVERLSCDKNNEEIPYEIDTFLKLVETEGFDYISLDELKRLYLIYEIRAKLNLYAFQPGDDDYKRVRTIKQIIDSFISLNISAKDLEDILDFCDRINLSISEITEHFPGIDLENIPGIKNDDDNKFSEK